MEHPRVHSGMPRGVQWNSQKMCSGTAKRYPAEQRPKGAQQNNQKAPSGMAKSRGEIGRGSVVLTI